MLQCYLRCQNFLPILYTSRNSHNPTFRIVFACWDSEMVSFALSEALVSTSRCLCSSVIVPRPTSPVSKMVRVASSIVLFCLLVTATRLPLPLQHIHLVLHLSLQFSRRLIVTQCPCTNSAAAHQLRSLHLDLHVRQLSLLRLVLLSERLHLLDDRRLELGGQHAGFDITLLEAIVGLLKLLFAVLDEGYYE